MRNWFCHNFAILLVVVGSSALFPVVGLASNQDALDELLVALNGDRFQSREVATGKIIGMGERAVAPLARHAMHASPEALRRIKRCLEEIGTSGSEETFFKSAALLSVLFGGGSQKTNEQIEQLRKEWRLKRTTQAIREMESLGAKFSGRAQQGQIDVGPLFLKHRSPDSAPVIGGEKKDAHSPALTRKQTEDQVALILRNSLPENRELVLARRDNLVAEPTGELVTEVVRLNRQFRLLNNRPEIIMLGGNNPLRQGPVVQIGPGWRGTPNDLQRLRNVNGLSSIKFEKQPVDRDTLEELHEWESLQQVTFDDCDISGKALAVVGIPANVTSLQFIRSGIDVSTIDRIDKTESLQQLSFNRCVFATAAFRRIFKMESLKVLEFRGAQINHGAFARLKSMKHLRALRLAYCKFSLEDYHDFQRTRPDISLESIAEAFLGVRSELPVRGSDGVDNCVVSDVIADSGAQKAGMKIGDRIAMINQQPVEDFDDLKIFISQHTAGDSIEIRVERDGEQIDLTVVLQGLNTAPPF